jgi:hypothetical protein
MAVGRCGDERSSGVSANLGFESVSESSPLDSRNVIRGRCDG